MGCTPLSHPSEDLISLCQSDWLANLSVCGGNINHHQYLPLEVSLWDMVAPIVSDRLSGVHQAIGMILME